MQRNDLGLLAAFLLGLMPIADAQAPEQILTPHYPWGATGSGQFGQAVGLSGSTLAVGSNEWDPAFTADGRVTVYERSPSGRWQFSQVLTRQPYFSIPSACGGCFGHGIEIVGDSMMVKGDAHVDSCWEFQRVDGIWTPHEQIGATTAPQWGGVGGMDYDGETLLVGYPNADAVGGGLDPEIRFWERQGTWTAVQTFRASELGIPGTLPSLTWGLEVAVHGDFAVASGRSAEQAGIIGVGVVTTFRRVNGFWEYEQTLRRPLPPTREHSFGEALALDDHWLFVSCFWDIGRIGAVYVYERASNETWELHSKIHPTANEATNLLTSGFGTQLQWVAPTLAVTSANYRVPSLPPDRSTGGAGSILLFELCDGVWDQRVGLTAPIAFGSGGLGLFAPSMSFDGQGIAAGAPFADFGGLYHAGQVAYTEVTPTTSGLCREIGRPACAPFDSETTDCPCGAVAAPGLGCPNAAGPGARLHLHGYYNEVEVRRAIVEGVAPDSLVLLLVGQPVPSLLPAGNVAGDGILCITPTTARAVGRSDASGQVQFEHVAVQPPLQFLAQLVGYELPMQALYRAPLPGPCNARWNATNAQLLSISTLGDGL